MGKEAVTFRMRYPRDYSEVKVTVWDAQRKPVPYTRFGKVASGDGPGRGSMAFIDLGPGKSRTVTLNLARMFDLTIPGQYSASVRWTLNEDKAADELIDLRLEKLAFKIAEEN
jgi:hypothetical protein